MSPLELTIAIAVGYALGNEISVWLNAWFGPVRNNLFECFRRERPWRALFSPVHYFQFEEWRRARGR